MNIFANVTWFDVIAAAILPFSLVTVVAAFLIARIVRPLVEYFHAEAIRERRESRARARDMGELLKAHRVRCGMTPEFVAEAVGVSRRAVARWEKGACALSTANLLPLADLYGVPMAELRDMGE